VAGASQGGSTCRHAGRLDVHPGRDFQHAVVHPSCASGRPQLWLRHVPGTRSCSGRSRRGCCGSRAQPGRQPDPRARHIYISALQNDRRVGGAIPNTYNIGVSLLSRGRGPGFIWIGRRRSIRKSGGIYTGCSEARSLLTCRFRSPLSMSLSSTPPGHAPSALLCRQRSSQAPTR
jgi:hypothetical protein